MELVILVIHVFLALGIIGVVLLQPPESSGLGGLGGANPMAGVSSSAGGNILTRTTAIFATLFIITSLTLAIIASHKEKTNTSILDAVPVAAANATEKPATAVVDKKPSVPAVPTAQ